MVDQWIVRNKFRGKGGLPGDAATVTVGTVVTGPPGSPATVVNAGTDSDAVLNFSIPRGGDGSNGSNGTNGTNGNNGSASTIAVGITTTGASGTSASVTNSGSSRAAVLNFTIPRGDASPAIIAAPIARTPAFGTAYATADVTKPSFISAVIDAAYTVTVLGTQSDTVELRIGPVQAQVAAGTGGFRVATFRASVTGIALVIGMGIGQGNQISGWVPSGWFWALRRITGTTATITSAVEQTLG